MNLLSHIPARFVLALLLLCGLCTTSSTGQLLSAPDIPDKFTWDVESASRLRPLLYRQSFEASGRFSTGQHVFEALIAQIHLPAHVKPIWVLRIGNETQLNAFSSPDGAIFVDRDLAQWAGSNAGLWAAILSHEIAHVLRRDWARPYLYEKSLERGGTMVSLGDPGLSGTWTDADKAS
jgi:Zn-dependent protease with chaperone function